MSQPSTTRPISQVEAVQFHHYPSGGQVQNGFRIPQHGQIIQSHNVQQHPRQAKAVREVLCVTKSTKPDPDVFDDLLANNTLRRTLRVLAWVRRFIHNCQSQEKRVDPLDTDEVGAAKSWWIRRIQSRDVTEVHYKETSARLNLRTDEQGITVCGGRILGSHPIYLPRDALFTEKLQLVQRVYCETLQGSRVYNGCTAREVLDPSTA